MGDWKAIDRACLELLGYRDIEWNGRDGWYANRPSGSWRLDVASPTRSDGFVVPLAEALRAKGHQVTMTANYAGRWYVAVGNWHAVADTIPEAIALAAARAVGTETKE